MKTFINLENIKKWVLIAMASDDELMEHLVLKGGNAIELIQRDRTPNMSRASYDLDYSLAADFEEEFDEIKARIQSALVATFEEKKLKVVDYQFDEKPAEPNAHTGDFWGGYKITFKIVPFDVYDKAGSDIEKIKRSALAVRPNNSTKIEIEISKYEYVEKKISTEVDGFVIYLYSPEMIVLEKLRAICQQMPGYDTIVPSFKPRARPRDFYDIHLIMTDHHITMEHPEMRELLDHIFSAKHVPVSFIQKIPENLAKHEQAWQAVEDTISAKDEIQPFRFYADFVWQQFGHIS